MLKGQNGKVCAAKTAFMVSLLVCLIKILLSGLVINGIPMESADYGGMAAFLSPLAAVYWGRSHTKSWNDTRPYERKSGND